MSLLNKILCATLGITGIFAGWLCTSFLFVLNDALGHFSSFFFPFLFLFLGFIAKEYGTQISIGIKNKFFFGGMLIGITAYAFTEFIWNL
ncbi:hypothetical protein [Maribacter sp. IgM3_T14_3]|uniref:hypothetical protein n=1 Tax=Maribacter sp. IgM3_T14_3 TaxID=3415140 RepID=UPI003C6FCE35